MKPFLTLIFASAIFSLVCSAPRQSALAQEGSAMLSRQGVDVEQVVRAIAAKETAFRRELNNYAFKRDAVIQQIGFGGQIGGEYHRVSNFTFDDSGNIIEKIIFAPMPTLAPSQNDVEDLGTIETYVLEASKIDQYSFAYVGKEWIDELNTYVFDINPKVMPTNKSQGRFFQGRIWVDDQDMQVVKARGKSVPEGKERFPTFEYYREQIDGHYWFPSYTYADDSLVLPTGEVFHVRLRIRFTDYERSHGKVRILEAEKDEPENKEMAKPKEKP
jgi:muconolactone delta-isomerase